MSQATHNPTTQAQAQAQFDSECCEFIEKFDDVIEEIKEQLANAKDEYEDGQWRSFARKLHNLAALIEEAGDEAHERMRGIEALEKQLGIKGEGQR